MARQKLYSSCLRSVDPDRNLLCVDSFGSGVIIQQFDLNYTNKLNFHALGMPQPASLVKDIEPENILAAKKPQEEKSLPADWLIELTQAYSEAADSWALFLQQRRRRV